jgi:hypothetical protein
MYTLDNGYVRIDRDVTGTEDFANLLRLARLIGMVERPYEMPASANEVSGIEITKDYTERVRLIGNGTSHRDCIYEMLDKSLNIGHSQGEDDFYAPQGLTYDFVSAWM